jgi:hypothetical protein
MTNLCRLSHDKVLSRMTTGVSYMACDLSKKLKAETYLVKAMLVKLERAGDVDSYKRSSDGSKCYVLRRTRIVQDPEAPKATPLIPILMTGELSGYECQFTRHRDLCMSIRRAA